MTNLLELINSGVTGVTLNVKLEDLVELVRQTIEAAKTELQEGVLPPERCGASDT